MERVSSYSARRWRVQRIRTGCGEADGGRRGVGVHVDVGEAAELAAGRADAPQPTEVYLHDLGTEDCRGSRHA
jgi:hypothetical protein